MSRKEIGPRNLRRAFERMEALPMRPLAARQVLSLFLDDDLVAPIDFATLPQSTATDPAWALERSRVGGASLDPLVTLSRSPWWLNPSASTPIAEALTRLWRHSTAVALASRKMARDTGDTDPDGIARAGLLHNLGIWGLAALAPEELVSWYEAPSAAARRDLEYRLLGSDAAGAGRALAIRWGCEPLVADAAWLHADLDGDLNRCSEQPSRLALIQQAYEMASMTPWAPGAEKSRNSRPIDPRVRILTAEVQARCVGSFIENDASAREERLTRDNARLRVAQARLIAEQASADRFIQSLSEATPTESPEVWADRAGLAWCGEPGVAAARVDWAGLASDQTAPPDPRPPSTVLPLGDPARPFALVRLWRSDEAHEASEHPSILEAWGGWAGQVAERVRLEKLLDEVVAAHRARVGAEEPTRRRLMLEAMAEFAAGAGHELNNPLAVIVGRAQLLLAKVEEDPDTLRSLRAIITQAQRAARILRDLMYIARPPEPRPRPCQPEEIVRASLRDLQAEADARGVRLVADTPEPGLRVWADPEPIRQLADILTRNALEASSSGGLVLFTAGGDTNALRWTIHDHGRGINASEGTHLFDPFYCGRQAGRGLGLGLPRASRILAQAGGELKWHSVPGVGTSFHVTFPVAEIPPMPDEERPGGPKSDRALLAH